MSDDGSNNRTRRGFLVALAVAIVSALILLFDALTPDDGPPTPDDGYGSGPYGGGRYGQ
jgi:hypothetical protein